MIQVEGNSVFTRIGVVEVRAAIVIPANALAGSSALHTPAVGRRVVRRKRLEVAQEINRAPLAPFDANNLGAETRQQASCLRSNLQPGQIDDPDTFESSRLYVCLIRHRTNLSSKSCARLPSRAAQTALN